MEIYNEKFMNFIAHIEKIAEYLPEIIQWVEKLKVVDLSLFISVAQIEGTFDRAVKCQKVNDITNRNIECLALIEKLAFENDFDQTKILENDKLKLCRYCQFFTVILSGL